MYHTVYAGGIRKINQKGCKPYQYYQQQNKQTHWKIFATLDEAEEYQKLYSEEKGLTRQDWVPYSLIDEIPVEKQQWVSGFLDGDGCISIGMRKKQLTPKINGNRLFKLIQMDHLQNF